MLFDVTSTTLDYSTFAAQYKVYAREVSHVDLSQRGGWALQGHPIKIKQNGSDLATGVHFDVGGSKDNLPVLFCLEHKDVSKVFQDPQGGEYHPSISKLGVLLIHETTYSLPTHGVPVHNFAFEDVNLRFSKSILTSYFPIAMYTGSQRYALTQEKHLDGWPTAGNPFRTVAEDLDGMIKQNLLKLTVPEDHSPQAAINKNLGESIHPNQAIFDGRYPIPSNFKLMGEIGGVALFQDRLNPYSQPVYLSEIIIAQALQLRPEDRDELLRALDFQEQSLAGQQAQISIARHVLSGLKKNPTPPAGGSSPF